LQQIDFYITKLEIRKLISIYIAK